MKNIVSKIENQAEEIRDILIDTTSKNGGHLAPNLGVVELTLCLHEIFDFEEDRLLFDVGHQSYVHKIITGRKERFSTLRQKDGIGPFMDPKESNWDPFISGHAGTALPAAVGIAIANPNKKVVVVVGDAAISNGHSLEALNYIGGNRIKNLIVILNDNNMSIGANVGMLSKFFARIMLSKNYISFRNYIRSLVDKINAKRIKNTLERLETSVKSFFIPQNVTENFGFLFLGAIDGHSVKDMLEAFSDVKDLEGPIFLHIKTEKGKGYKFAEQNLENFHGAAPFDIETGEFLEKKETYSHYIGKKLLEIFEEDGDIYALSSGMIKGTGLSEVFKKFPNRCIDTGISEGFTVTAAAGLAISGKKPYICLYSTFLQRGFSQIIHDIIIQNLPVRFIVDRAGIVGEDGKTHNGNFDLPFFMTLPNITIVFPGSVNELEDIMEISKNFNSGPLVIRVSKDKIYELEKNYKFEIGKWNEIKKGKKNLFLAVGTMLKEIIEVDSKLQEKGIDGTIVSVASIIPFDSEYLRENLDNYENIFVLEEVYKRNSFATLLVEWLNENRIGKHIIDVSLGKAIFPHGKREELLEESGLKGDMLVKRIEELIYEREK